MTTWSEGYVADIGYTYGYYTELNPLRSRFALIKAGLKPPSIKNACELGFGQPRTIGELEQAAAAKGITLPQIIEIALVMASLGHLAPVQDQDLAKGCRKHAHNLNKALIKRAHHGSEIGVLASPLTGGGLPVERFSQLFVEAVLHGKKSADDLAHHAWTIFAAQGQSIIKDGKALEGEAANLAELKLLAGKFLAHQLPILRAMQVVG